MDATKRLYQTLVEQGEQTLEQAKTGGRSRTKIAGVSARVQHSQTIRLEADLYRQKVIAQTKGQS